MQQIIIKRLSCFGRGRFGLAIVWSILWGAGMWGQGWRWGFITFSVWIKGNARLLFCLFFSSMNLSSFSIGFDSNMQHIPQPSRQQTVLQEFINLRRGIDPKSFTSWGNAKDTSFSALSYASKYIKKKKKCCNYFWVAQFCWLFQSCWEHTSVCLDFHLRPHFLVSFYWRSSLNCPGFKAVSFRNCRDVPMRCWCFQEGSY